MSYDDHGFKDVWVQGFSVAEIKYDNFCTTKIKYIMYKSVELSVITTLVTQLYVRIGILLTYVKYLHDRIISLRGEVLVYKTILTPPLCIEDPCTKPRKWAVMHMYAKGIDSAF
jgi:hypothetical protein